MKGFSSLCLAICVGLMVGCKDHSTPDGEVGTEEVSTRKSPVVCSMIFDLIDSETRKPINQKNFSPVHFEFLDLDEADNAAFTSQSHRLWHNYNGRYYAVWLADTDELGGVRLQAEGFQSLVVRPIGDEIQTGSSTLSSGFDAREARQILMKRSENNAADQVWRFAQSRNYYAITSTYVIRDDKLITHVYHVHDDEGNSVWRFHSSSAGCPSEEAMLVRLMDVVKADPSVMEVATLPPGWMAKRAPEGGVWLEQRNPDNPTEVVVNWEKIPAENAFFDLVLPQCEAPSWHGRNLDALEDSWVDGAINGLGPPYRFRFSNSSNVPSALRGFCDLVHEIAEASVVENGGHLEVAEDGAEQPATSPESKPEGSEKPQPESEVSPR